MNHLDTQEAREAEVEHLVMDLLTTLDCYDSGNRGRLCSGLPL